MQLDRETFARLRQGDMITCDEGRVYGVIHNAGIVVRVYDHESRQVVSCLWSVNFNEVLTYPEYFRVRMTNAKITKAE